MINSVTLEILCVGILHVSGCSPPQAFLYIYLFRHLVYYLVLRASLIHTSRISSSESVTALVKKVEELFLVQAPLLGCAPSACLLYCATFFLLSPCSPVYPRWFLLRPTAVFAAGTAGVTVVQHLDVYSSLCPQQDMYYTTGGSYSCTVWVSQSKNVKSKLHRFCLKLGSWFSVLERLWCVTSWHNSSSSGSPKPKKSVI